MPTPFTGPAGEHYVLYRLIQKEYVAGLASQNAPNSDIIVTNIQGSKSAAIQVKTRRPLGSDGGWHMKAKHETIKGERMFYCFVNLKNQEIELPEVYVIPSMVVADILRKTHEMFLKKPGRNGKMHNATDMRRLLPDYSIRFNLSEKQQKIMGRGWMEKYKENWSILGLDS